MKPRTILSDPVPVLILPIFSRKKNKSGVGLYERLFVYHCTTSELFVATWCGHSHPLCSVLQWHAVANIGLHIIAQYVRLVTVSFTVCVTLHCFMAHTSVVLLLSSRLSHSHDSPKQLPVCAACRNPAPIHERSAAGFVVVFWP